MSLTPNNKFPEHFRDFIKVINDHDVEYMLIGGYAMGVYGHFRGTGDLDIFINTTNENADRMMKACLEYGIPEESLKKEMFLVPKMVGIGSPPLRIEILKKLDVVDFAYAYKRSKLETVDDLKVRAVDLDDLILLKKAAKKGRIRARDSEDLDYLEKLKNRLKKR